MKGKKGFRTFAVVASGAILATALPLTACGPKRDSIVVMAEQFSGLFNPFYATAGADMDVVGMTQLSMLTTDSKGELVAGENEATVVLDYEIDTDGADSVYTFVLKNGLKFSDGKPLTMNDVMFNIYEYLDPVYTGSSTMYSIKIKGLQKYRTQQFNSGSSTSQKSDADEAYSWAKNRRSELLDVYKRAGKQGSSGSETYYCTPDEMRTAIANYTISSVYKSTVSNKTETDEWYHAKLLEDYELVLKTFRKELESDFDAAQESFDLENVPYKKWASKFKSETFRFFLYEDGYITPEYKDVQGKKDKTEIIKFNGEQDYAQYDTKQKAVDRVFGDKIAEDFLSVAQNWGTAGDILTQFSAEATELILAKRQTGDKLNYPRVDGVVSLGHKVNGEYVATEFNGENNPIVKIAQADGTDKTYPIAREHNEDGTPKNAGEYDVLRITVEGKDPKAKYNFSFSVAPAHYYTADADHPNGREIDIEDDNFGVEYGSASFQGKVIQSQQHVEIPVGAGPYKATNAANSDNPAGAEFWRNNYIYYKRNDHFMFPVKTEKFQYQYVSSSNALDKLENREIDFVTPQLTKPNSDRLTKMAKKGFARLSAPQLGYGYIGINAGKVKNINIRKAIMSAMQAYLATQYYETGTCEVIHWPMSKESWAYPSGTSQKDYLEWAGVDKAKEKIKDYTNKAGTDAKLNYKFTIAGASITEHPTYSVFKQAAELLNECGWNVEVKADSQALTKLSTGSLEVWAAAWGSTIDPDMYQVYHKDSTATSVYAWGYREIKASPSAYPTESGIITQLSALIDQGRSTLDQEERKNIYKEAMNCVLNLAVEMPVYQRENLYAYDANRLSGINENVNPYTSPLEKIWNIELNV